MINYPFHLTRSINNNISNFALILGRISALDAGIGLMPSIIEENLKRASLAAVTIDKNILDKVELERIELNGKKNDLTETLRKDFIFYTSAKLDLAKKAENIDIKFIKLLHQRLLNKQRSEFRKIRRLLPKEVTQNWVVKKIEMEVKTAPGQIKEKIENFIKWLQDISGDENPIIVAGIAHFVIAEIHPFDDGNGRLGRLMEYAIMKSRNMDITSYVATEVFYLTNSERYYNLIETAVESKDLTEWLEFFTEALLTSIIFTVRQIYKNTGGCIDILNNKIIKINEIEQRIIELMRKLNQPSPSEIAQVLGTSRQNVYYFLKGLYEKGVLQKVGKNTGSRYKLKT